MWLVRDRTMGDNPKVFDVKFEGATFTCLRCGKEFILPCDFECSYPICEKCLDYYAEVSKNEKTI